MKHSENKIVHIPYSFAAKIRWMYVTFLFALLEKLVVVSIAAGAQCWSVESGDANSILLEDAGGGSCDSSSSSVEGRGCHDGVVGVVGYFSGRRLQRSCLYSLLLNCFHR